MLSQLPERAFSASSRISPAPLQKARTRLRLRLLAEQLLPCDFFARNGIVDVTDQDILHIINGQLAVLIDIRSFDLLVCQTRILAGNTHCICLHCFP